MCEKANFRVCWPDPISNRRRPKPLGSQYFEIQKPGNAVFKQYPKQTTLFYLLVFHCLLQEQKKHLIEDVYGGKCLGLPVTSCGPVDFDTVPFPISRAYLRKCLQRLVKCSPASSVCPLHSTSPHRRTDNVTRTCTYPVMPFGARRWRHIYLSRDPLRLPEDDVTPSFPATCTL